jgi:ribosomal protein L21
VTAKVVRQVKGPKVVIGKFRKRKNSRRRTGFRARSPSPDRVDQRLIGAVR